MKFNIADGKLKKIASDKETTTFQHEDGHKIVIAHKALSPKMRSQLATLPVHKTVEAKAVKSAGTPVKMAEGGEPVAEQAAQQQAPQAEALPAATQIAQEASQPDPSLERKRQLYNTRIASASASNGDKLNINNTFRPDGSGPQMFDPEAWQQAEQDYTGEIQAQQQRQQTISQNSAAENEARARAGLPQIPVPAMAGTAQQPQQAAQAQQQAPQVGAPATQAPAESSNPLDGYSNIMAKGYQSQLRGVEHEQQAATQISGERAKLDAAQVEDLQKQRARTEDVQNQAIAEYNSIKNDIQKNHIKPNAFLENMPAEQKVRTAIGLILGGIGGGLMRQENPALKFLNMQMERDFQAQKVNQETQLNLLSHSSQLFKNVTDADNFTRAAINEMYVHMIDQAASKQGGAMAQANAEKLKGQLMQQNAFYLSNIGKSGGNMDDWLASLRIANPAMAKEIESRYIPSVGVASVPVPEKSRAEITERKALQDQIVNLRRWAQQHSGTLNPADMIYGQTLAKTVQDAYRRANGQGVFREAEAKFVNGIVAEDPSAFFNRVRTDPKYKALEQSNQAQLNGLFQTLGIKATPGSSAGNTGFVPKTFKPSR